jgi:hypothetical protein
MGETCPILEYDPEGEAIIEPGRIIRLRDIPEHCVHCIFREVVENVAHEYHARVAVENHWEENNAACY